MFGARKAICQAWVGVLPLLLAACSTSSPTARYRDPAMAAVKLDADDQALVVLATAAGVTMTELEQRRLRESVQSAIVARKVHNDGDGRVQRYRLELTIVRYEKGNAAARAVFPGGVSQIHIDSTAALVQLGDPERRVSEFDLNKTFAWGGPVGAVTPMTEVEYGFAAGCAEAIAGGPLPRRR
jgi:hypothetical protein